MIVSNFMPNKELYDQENTNHLFGNVAPKSHSCSPQKSH